MIRYGLLSAVVAYYAIDMGKKLYEYYLTGEPFGTEHWILLALIIIFIPTFIFTFKRFLAAMKKENKEQEEAAKQNRAEREQKRLSQFMAEYDDENYIDKSAEAADGSEIKAEDTAEADASETEGTDEGADNEERL